MLNHSFIHKSMKLGKFVQFKALNIFRYGAIAKTPHDGHLALRHKFTSLLHSLLNVEQNQLWCCIWCNCNRVEIIFSVLLFLVQEMWCKIHDLVDAASKVSQCNCTEFHAFMKKWMIFSHFNPTTSLNKWVSTCFLKKFAVYTDLKWNGRVPEVRSHNLKSTIYFSTKPR